MSNPDSFIDEVTEEVRRDRLFGLFRRYGWIAVVLVLLLVGGAAVREWQKARAEAEAERFGDAVLGAIEAPDGPARTEALAAISADGGRGAVLRFLIAADAVNAKDRAAALIALDGIIADTSLSQSYRDLAALKRVMLAGADLPAADRIAVLEGLATPGRAFRPLALEQIAMIAVETGQTADAIAGLRDVLKEPQVTEGLRRRVTQVMVAMGADPEAQ